MLWPESLPAYFPDPDCEFLFIWTTEHFHTFKPAHLPQMVRALMPLARKLQWRMSALIGLDLGFQQLSCEESFYVDWIKPDAILSRCSAEHAFPAFLSTSRWTCVARTFNFGSVHQTSQVFQTSLSQTVISFFIPSWWISWDSQSRWDVIPAVLGRPFLTGWWTSSTDPFGHKGAVAPLRAPTECQ